MTYIIFNFLINNNLTRGVSNSSKNWVFSKIYSQNFINLLYYLFKLNFSKIHFFLFIALNYYYY